MIMIIKKNTYNKKEVATVTTMPLQKFMAKWLMKINLQNKFESAKAIKDGKNLFCIFQNQSMIQNWNMGNLFTPHAN